MLAASIDPAAPRVTKMSAETVAVFAPGGYDGDPLRLAQARRYFEERGDRVVFGLEPDRRHERFSAPDDERLRWLAHVATDPSIDIAIALRGGYGATRLLPRIDFDAIAAAIRRHGKRLVGHSDFTAIGLGLLARTGAVSFAGPMASYDFGAPDVDPFTEEHFWRAMRACRVDVEFATRSTAAVRATGRLWGGNLTMLASLVGTPWLPVVDDGILFIEDINEQPYRIERMMFQLLQAGILDRQRVVLCGDVSGFRVVAYDQGYGVAEALARVQQETAVPLVDGLPFGHCRQKLTLAVGADATVDVEAGRCRLLQRWDLATI